MTRCPGREGAPEHPARHGRPARGRAPPGVRQCRRARTATLGAGGRGRGVRERVLRVAALRALALRTAGRPTSVTDRCIRQRRRAPRRHSHDRARPARRRLRHRTRGQDALRRPRSAARLRGAPDHGRLSVGLRLDAGLAPAGRRAPRVVPQRHEPAVVPGRRGGDADRLRRRGLLPRCAEDPRPLAAPGRPAVLPHGLVHESARPVGDPAALLGPVRRARDRRARRRGAAARARRTRTACACAT